VKESTSWDVTLLAWEQKKADGTKVERYGTKPQGVAFFDAEGRFIIAVMKSDRTNYASNALWQGTHTKTQKPPTARLLNCAPNLEQQGSIEPHLARLRTQPNTCAMASDDNYILDSDGNRILIGLTLDETREATHCDMPPNSA
jgi:hypothetical protein